MREPSPCVGICTLVDGVCIGCGRSIEEIAEAGNRARAVVYHICRGSEWRDAVAAGVYRGSSQDQADGFIHFSTAAQVAGSAAKHRAGQTGLVLVACAAGRLGSGLRWETARNGQDFPHFYGSLPLDAVLAVVDLPLEDGRHRFPLLRETI
ncbi:MAG TPA: DUF952 domain-containing protein [Rhodospirillaceae bacterium]|nr:DUF952 domain-containing protein [Rhodospirillaceae bacterium]